MTVRIRQFRIDDYEAAVRLWNTAEGIEIAEGDAKADVALFLKRNATLSQVAMVGKEIVAVVMCGHDGRRGHIYHLAVAPAFQRRGLANRLVAECLARLRAVGIQRAIILVAGDNACGRSFWRSAGWEEIPGSLAMG